MSWSQLRDVRRENARLIAEDAAGPLKECPNDGSPIEFVPRLNAWRCPFGGELFAKDGTEIVR